MFLLKSEQKVGFSKNFFPKNYGQNDQREEFYILYNGIYIKPSTSNNIINITNKINIHDIINKSNKPNKSDILNK